MANDLIVQIDGQLTEMLPDFRLFMAGIPLQPERLIRTVMISLERTPKLLECTRQSVINAAVTMGVLGLECDGATGQGFLVPFGGKAQTIIGYKGYNTMAARNGMTVTGSVVREGDDFDIDKGAGLIRHKPQLLGAAGDRRIIGAWAKAEALDRPGIVEWMSIDDLLVTKNRSPGAKKTDSPWNDATGPGFPAMCSKTVKRRLAASMPLGLMVTGAAMESAHEDRGLYSYIDPSKGVIASAPKLGTAAGPSGELDLMPVEFRVYRAQDDKWVVCRTIEEWRAKMILAIEKYAADGVLPTFAERNAATIIELGTSGFSEIAGEVDNRLRAALTAKASA